MKRRCMLIVLVLALGAAAFLTVAGAVGDPPDDGRRVRDSATTDLRRIAPRYTADELVLLSIQEEGIARVRELAVELAAEKDASRRYELKKRVVEIKRETRLRFLETLAAQAQERGEFAEVDAARAEIERIRNPYRPSTPSIRQRPDKSLIEGGK
jgi:hypothetical protein